MIDTGLQGKVVLVTGGNNPYGKPTCLTQQSFLNCFIKQKGRLAL